MKRPDRFARPQTMGSQSAVHRLNILQGRIIGIVHNRKNESFVIGKQHMP